MIRRLMWILCVASLPALAADITTTWTYPTQNTDSSIIPLTLFDFAITPDGSDVVMTGGTFFRAA